VIEDCGVTPKEFVEHFDEEIYTLVDSVTKIGNLQFTDEKEYQAANHRKILIAMARDIRVILIKLVDRLHNMRTLQYMPHEKQLRISQETLDVYAPIAHRLGISEIKNELEDLCFFFLMPEKYHEVAKMVEVRKAERDQHVETMIQQIQELLAPLQFDLTIFGRSKHLYSIYRKMTTKNKRFDEILDLLAIRIIIDTKDKEAKTAKLDCYEVLGYIHQEYFPIQGRLKDYIATPKMNMYQSLHTTVVGVEGQIFEVQIRTKFMDDIAEQGVAAHWRYKEGTRYNAAREQKEIEEKLSWFRDIFAISEDMDNAEGFMDAMQRDLFEANVYVMSPKGRVIDLPNGSTPIDFAYRIHTEVGNATVGAIVNNTMVPLNTILKTGDVVQLKTAKNTGPSEDWLKFVKTSHARSKIKSYLARREAEDRKPLVEQGEKIYKEEMGKREIDPDLITGKKLESVPALFSFGNLPDFYYAIATKTLPVNAIAEKLGHKKGIFEDLNLTRLFKSPQHKNTTPKSVVKVAGIDSIKIELAGCCNPVYGDEIVGYVSKGQGVKVHRSNCPNIAQGKRLIDCEWTEMADDQKFEAVLHIDSINRNYLLTDLVTVVSQYKAALNAIDSHVNDDRITATTIMTLAVSNAEHLRVIMANLAKVDSVRAVERMIL